MPGILLDLDGVFYVGDQVIPGALETLSWIQENNIAHCFLTNTTSRPRKHLVEKLARLGIDTNAAHMITPAVVAVHWIQEHVTGATALFVPEATKDEFSELSITETHSDTPVAAVVIGDLGEAWDYATLNQAFRLLMQKPKPRLIALGMTRYWRAPDGLRLDVAPFIHALQHAADIQAVVLGKPATAFFATALDKLQLPANQAIMLGDDIRGDVGGAQAAGIQGILVRTGKFQATDLAGDIKPMAILDSIADLPGWWRQQAFA